MMRATMIPAALALAGCGSMLVDPDRPPAVALDLDALIEAYQEEGVEIGDLSPENLRRLRLACLTSAALNTRLDEQAAAVCEAALKIAKPVEKPEI